MKTVIAPVDAGADVWVNGERIGVVTGATERTLRRGDRVAVGKNSGLVFRFDDEDGATRDAETETPKPSKCSALRTSSSSSRDFAAETATSTTSASASNAEEWWGGAGGTSKPGGDARARGGSAAAAVRSRDGRRSRHQEPGSRR